VKQVDYFYHERKNMFKKFVCCLSLFLVLLLTACGQPETDDIPEPNHNIHDWKTESWRRSEDIYNRGTFYVEKYISGLEYQPEQEYDNCSSRYRCWGSNFYALTTYTISADSSSQNIYYLSCYSDATDEIRHQRIELPKLEEYEGAEMYVSSFDIQNPQEYVLFAQVWKDEEARAYLAMHFSPEGEFLSAADLYPAIQANGCALEGKLFFPDVYIDHEGRYFFISPFGERKIVVLDTAGKTLTELTWDNEDIFPLYAMKTAEGEPVFELYSNKAQEMRLVMYNPSTGGERVFTEQLPSSSPKGITSDGILYYGEKGQLYRWDLYTGDIGVCFSYEETGLGRNNYMTYIGISGTGFPIIMDTSREKAVICKLGSEPVEEGDPIHLASLVKDSSFIASGAIMFSQEHMEHPILMQQPKEALADFRTRSLADLTAGKGADIYYVSAEDMRILYGKGVLADLSDVLGDDLREAIYKGALSCGVIDGQQIGLPPEAYVTTLLVSDELWPKDSWTLEDVMEMMDEHPEFTRIMSSRRYMSKKTALRMLLLQDLPNSPFLDMDAGTCDFDNPLFIRALELVNEAAGGNDNPAESGGCAAFQVSMENFENFSNEMSRIGEGFHPVGFPTEAGSGNYWNADYFLVVNAQAEHRDLIDAYLASLFSLPRQRESSHPVRNDIIEASISYMDVPQPSWQYTMGGGVYHPLATKPDGSPWTEEYKDILSRAVPRPQNTSYIEEIILEEAAGYLSGIKTAEQVAEIIQNRVQLYLNERQ